MGLFWLPDIAAMVDPGFDRSYFRLYDELQHETHRAADLQELLFTRSLSTAGRFVRGFVRDRMTTAAMDAEQLRLAVTRKERDHPYLGVACASYFVETLADMFLATHDLSLADVHALQSVHDLRAAEASHTRSVMTGARLRAIAIAAAAFLATQLPKESFTALGLEGVYGWYRLALFAFLIGFLLLLISLARRGSQLAAEAGLGERDVSTLGATLTICAVRLTQQEESRERTT